MIISLFRRIAFLAGLLLAGLLSAQTGGTVPASARPFHRGPQPGEVAPDFTVVGPDGKDVRLSDFRGKTVLVDIWATWCGPCVASMPHNSELAEKHAKDGLVILAVCADDSRANYDGWVKRNSAKYKFLTAHDPAGRDGWDQSVFNTKYGVGGFPTLFLIDKDGRLVGSTSGGGQGENPHVTRLLAKGGVPVDTSHLPPEDKSGPKSIPMVGKTPAMKTAMLGGMSAGEGKFGSVNAGEPVTDFTATGADGKPVRLSDFKGKVVIVTFFTNTERGPETYAPATAAKYAAQDVVLLALGSAMEQAGFEAWAKKTRPAYAAAWDSAGKAWGENISHMNFGVGMYPAFVVVTKEGRLSGGYIGMGDRNVSRLHALLQAAGVKLADEDRPPAALMMAAAIIKPMGGAPAAAPKTATLGAGAFAPDFAMQDVNGREVKLSDFKGKVVILDFWATWCGPCIASMPHTQEIAAKYRDQGAVVLASGTSDKIAKFKEWIPKNQPKYPDMLFAYDPNERDSATFEERASQKFYHVVGIPTQFVIGRDGVITATIVGNGGKEDARTEAALARAGVKVEAARIAEGEKQLKAAAEEDADRAAAIADEEKNPKPHFYESYGKLKAGQPVPDFAAETADGAAVKFSEFTKGKTVVLSFWSAGHGIPADMLAYQDAWAKKYAAQGVLFVGVGGYGSREDFIKWHADHAPKISFPVLFDPAGASPRPAKPPEEMNDQEKAALKAAAREYYGKVIPMHISGGMMAPIPNNTVIDAQGKFLGFYVGAGPQSAESLGNLLLRAGVKLAPEDMPKKVFTAEETKEKPPEARVDLLKAGALAPDFPATDAAGKAVKVSDYRGKVVILDFWATWCGPCLASMPHTQEVAAHYKDQGVVVLASCTSDDRKKFDAWVKRNQEQFPDILFSHDPQERGPGRASHKLYGVGGIPQQFIIDREGRVAALVSGYLKGENILDAALAKAGIKVDPALVAKGAEDLKKRE
jgi:peroxiredoxin